MPKFYVRTNILGPIATIKMEPDNSKFFLKNSKKYGRRPFNKRSRIENLMDRKCGKLDYELSGRGNRLLIYEGHRYIKNNEHGSNIYWKCTKWHGGCKARAITSVMETTVVVLKNIHNHPKISDVNNSSLFSDSKDDSEFD